MAKKKTRGKKEYRDRYTWNLEDIVIEQEGEESESPEKKQLKSALQALKGTAASGNWGNGGLASLGLRDDEPLIRRRIAAKKRKKNKGKDKKEE